ncbi:hypothetical protein BDA96_08G142400 [Sorghum bicolor]|uniref:Uncharacterized protein n=2 Tax=Sorghum bicolor TaxID=4558 RepID=A0A921U7H6_SORBI|nr:hypothetical protein BDA96_08G142400 [Sorghum bicolor]KXG23700.1 hypothetical protein SORBI_3008G129500 [Sorghum bicolor]
MDRHTASLHGRQPSRPRKQKQRQPPHRHPTPSYRHDDLALSPYTPSTVDTPHRNGIPRGNPARRRRGGGEPDPNGQGNRKG